MLVKNNCRIHRSWEMRNTVCWKVPKKFWDGAYMRSSRTETSYVGYFRKWTVRKVNRKLEVGRCNRIWGRPAIVGRLANYPILNLEGKWYRIGVVPDVDRYWFQFFVSTVFSRCILIFSYFCRNSFQWHLADWKEAEDLRQLCWKTVKCQRFRMAQVLETEPQKILFGK